MYAEGFQKFGKKIGLELLTDEDEVIRVNVAKDKVELLLERRLTFDIPDKNRGTVLYELGKLLNIDECSNLQHVRSL